jgi:hypothetical protein
MNRPGKGRSVEVRSPHYLLLTAGALLNWASLIVNVSVGRDRPDRQAGLPWWAQFVADTRRHPVLRVIQLAFLGASTAMLIIFFVVGT